jgi:hypothetical protein
MAEFANIVEITGANNQTLKLDSTDVLPNGQPRSTVILSAVTTNKQTESQLQFNGKFTLAAPPAVLGTPLPLVTVQENGRVAIGPYEQAHPEIGALTVSGEGNQGIALVCTDNEGNPVPSGSRCDLIAVVTNPDKRNGEAQLQFKGEFTLAAPPAALGNPVPLMTVQEDGDILIRDARKNMTSLMSMIESLQNQINSLQSQINGLSSVV